MSDTREVRTIEEALALVDEWAEAYAELRRDYLRLQERCADVEFWSAHYQDVRRHLDPFLPPDMQVAEWREAEPRLYANIAQHLRAPKRRSPFDEPELAEADPFA